MSRVRAEKALRAAATEQALANRAKSEFLANMSHELRTPLNAVIGFSDLLCDQRMRASSQAKTLEYAGLINSAGKHLLGIISDILDVSKIESGTFELDHDRCSLREVIVSAAAFVETRIAEKMQVLDLNLPPLLPMITADARRLKQVVINLLSNAHKFTPNGGHIIVTATACTPGWVSVAVCDSGIGMTPEQIVVALKPFGQVRSGRTRSHEGTGLGLPIAKALIEHHGGMFSITSTENVGTTVTFTIPENGAKPAKERHP
ncbi:MAG: HAMP domain-containing histidine kinase [Alphaproteobacteria bacterium]|nr:HAMP domain-containing histidine kinase [Alphaproteobacteria bacterium]